MSVAVPPNRAKTYRGRNLGGPADLHTAWAVLAGSAADAAVTLTDVMENSTVPGARVAAAKTLLEMVGFKTPDYLPVLPPEHDGAGAAVQGDSPAERIRNRMAALAKAEQATMTVLPTLDELSDAQVVEGVVVDGQP